ncbi:MAG: hypothetical protein WEE64_15625 [Dehalococcoidia bacterium]
MEMMNWSLLDVIVAQKTLEMNEERKRVLLLEEASDEGRGSARAALGRTFVRLGLQLDPSAGEGLRPTRLASAGK